MRSRSASSFGGATIMALRIDDSTIAFATNHGTHLFHLCRDVHLAHSSSSVLATVLLGHVAQGTGRGEIAHGISLIVGKDIVGYADQRVFLTKHLTVFADESQTVNVGVDYDAQVETALSHLVHDALQVLLQWLGVVGKLSGALAIENLEVYTQSLEQLRQNDAAHAVDSIGTNAELMLANRLYVDQAQVEYRLHVALVHRVVLDDTSQFLYGSIVEILSFGNAQHFGSVGCSEEFSLAVEQLQGIPLCGIVRGCDDNAAVGLVPAHGQFGGGCGGQANVDDLITHAYQCATYHIAHHRSGDASVAPYNNTLATNEGGVCSSKLNNV